jgi:hypothetical protein
LDVALLHLIVKVFVNGTTRNMADLLDALEGFAPVDNLGVPVDPVRQLAHAIKGRIIVQLAALNAMQTIRLSAFPIAGTFIVGTVGLTA